MRRLAAVADGVYVATAVKYTTTTTVLVRPDRTCLVIDPAWTPPELDALAADIADLEVTVTAGFATHAHQDHVLWHPGLGNAARWASPTTVELAQRWRDELMAALGDDLTPELAALFGDLQPLPGDTVPGFAIRVVTHDGHAPGHSALLDDETGVLVAGDMLSDIELPLPFDPDDLPAYLVALDRLAPVVGEARLLVPGHGHPTTDPMARLDADRRYLDGLLHGEDAADDRRANPGMTEAHDRLLAMVRDGAV